MLRLALLYALIDGCRTIRTAHLRAEVALWAQRTRPRRTGPTPPGHPTAGRPAEIWTAVPAP